MPELVIEPSDLDNLIKTKTENLVIIDLGKEERYLNAHIPGALLVTPAQTQAGAPIPGFAPSEEQLSQLMQSLGIDENSHIIVYDDEGGGWAGRFIWLLDEIGLSNHSYLDGGLHAWANEERALEQGPSAAISISNFVAKLSGEHSVTKEEILDSLPLSGLQVWDARSPMEHSGETAYAARGGRIPGSLNYEWTQVMDQQNSLRLKPIETLKQELANAGIDPSIPTITHCQTHHRSGLTYLVAKILNFDSIKAYPGSWGEWGNSTETPIEVS